MTENNEFQMHLENISLAQSRVKLFVQQLTDFINSKSNQFPAATLMELLFANKIYIECKLGSEKLSEYQIAKYFYQNQQTKLNKCKITYQTTSHAVFHHAYSKRNAKDSRRFKRMTKSEILNLI